MLNIKKCIHQRIKKWTQKTKGKILIYEDMVHNLTIKIKKERNRTLVLVVQVLNYSRVQGLLICFETSEDRTLNLIGQTNQINKRQML